MYHQLHLRLYAFICSLLLFSRMFTFSSYAGPDWPSDMGIEAEAGIVIDMDSGAVLYGQNIHNQYPPASITKLLTALVVLEHCQPDEIVTYSNHALMSVEKGSGNKLSLREGDQLSVEDSLYGLLLVSANQCANGLAEHTAGSMEAFVDLMNQKVAELGLTESHFDNPSGLNGDTQYVSAYDMAMIARAAFSNPKLLEIDSALTHKIGGNQIYPDGQSIRHEHRLLYTTDTNSPFYCPEAVAGKTGYLIAAGNTLVTYGERDGRRVVSVVLKGRPKQYFVDSKNLLLFGLDRFQNLSIAEQETRYITGAEILERGNMTYAAEDLFIEPDTVVTIPKQASFHDLNMSLEDLESDAPVGAVGRLVYTYNDRQVGSAWLMTSKLPAVEVSTDPSSAVKPYEHQELGFLLSDIPIVTVLTWIMVFLILVVVIGGASWIISSRKKEEAAAQARKARRMERMSTESDELRAEYERMIKERRKH